MLLDEDADFEGWKIALGYVLLACNWASLYWRFWHSGHIRFLTLVLTENDWVH